MRFKKIVAKSPTASNKITATAFLILTCSILTRYKSKTISFKIFQLFNIKSLQHFSKINHHNFVYWCKTLSLQSKINPNCGCGVIGSRTRLRIWRFTAWGFESLHPHNTWSRFVKSRRLQFYKDIDKELIVNRCVVWAREINLNTQYSYLISNKKWILHKKKLTI